MRAAGIRDPKPNHLKHAATTALEKAGVRDAQIVAFNRHKAGSAVWAAHYWDHKDGKVCVDIILKMK